jgi:predicted phosphodiesterase
MRTLAISDLHLGGRDGADVLRDPTARAALLEALRDVDRLVLLGDTLELRHGPARKAMAAARPVLQAIGEALDEAAEVVVVPGNHDHALIAPWLEARRQPLGLATRVRPATASAVARQVAQWLGSARTHLAYPGHWLREDVYAMHGHYLDPHGRVPTFERLAAGVMVRLTEPLPDPATPEDYERVLAPLYAWIHSSAQHARDGRVGAGAGRVGRVYALLEGDGHRPARGRALALALPLGIRGANALGLGPLDRDLSGAALRRNALRAMGEVIARLSVSAEHVVFGHSHRAGPLPGDATAEWRAPTGARLHNAGCWVHDPVFTRGAGSAGPYWPGSAVLVEDRGPPRLLRLPVEVSPRARA